VVALVAVFRRSLINTKPRSELFLRYTHHLFEGWTVPLTEESDWLFLVGCPTTNDSFEDAPGPTTLRLQGERFIYPLSHGCSKTQKRIELLLLPGGFYSIKPPWLIFEGNTKPRNRLNFSYYCQVVFTQLKPRG
jgi:hypothetical protein